MTTRQSTGLSARPVPLPTASEIPRHRHVRPYATLAPGRFAGGMGRPAYPGARSSTPHAIRAPAAPDGWLV